jgi:hypothetical protein
MYADCSKGKSSMKDRHKKIKKRQTKRIDLKGENEESYTYVMPGPLILMINYMQTVSTFIHILIHTLYSIHLYI